MQAVNIKHCANDDAVEWVSDHIHCMHFSVNIDANVKLLHWH